MIRSKKQLDSWGICTGSGLLVYLILLKLGSPAGVNLAVSAIGCAASGWTLLSLLTYPKDAREGVVNYNNLWGQSAMTLLWVACLYLAIQSL